MTGDYGDECRILPASCDFCRVQIVLQGNQQVRTVAAVPTEDALYFSSDTPPARIPLWDGHAAERIAQIVVRD